MRKASPIRSLLHEALDSIMDRLDESAVQALIEGVLDAGPSPDQHTDAPAAVPATDDTGDDDVRGP